MTQHRLLLDRGAHTGHSGGVRHGQVVGVAHGTEGVHLDLAALMEAERAIPPVEHSDAVKVADGGHYLAGVFGRLGEHVDFPHHDQALGLESRDGGDVAARVADGGGESTERSGSIAERYLDGYRVGGGGCVQVNSPHRRGPRRKP